MPAPKDVSVEFAVAITRKFTAMHPESYASNLVTVEAGNKFDKLVISTAAGQHRSVHAFVDRSTGGLIKAAGWAKPAKGKYGLAVRFNLLTDLDDAVAAADPYGSYLYAR